VIYLELEDLLHIAARVLEADPLVRDHGLLDSARGRARASVLGEDAYPSVDEKAAALLHSLARNHVLVDGNERLALGASIASYGMNGIRPALSNDEAHELVMAVSSGELEDVRAIAGRLGARTGIAQGPAEASTGTARPLK